jgi:hypothetical protein
MTAEQEKNGAGQGDGGPGGIRTRDLPVVW